MRLDNVNRIQIKGDHHRAVNLYRKYLDKRPDDALAELLLGSAFLQMGEIGQGADYIQRALKKAPDLITGYVNLVAALRMSGRLEEALAIGSEALERFSGAEGKARKELKSLYTNTGTCYLELGSLEKAEESFRKAIEIDPEDSDAHWNLGLAFLGQCKFKEGWQEYGWGFRSSERLARPYWNEFKEWTGEPLKGKTILVWGEQGIGDEMLFASCLKDIQRDAKAVIFDCHPRLQTLFQRSFPSIKCIGTRKNNMPGIFDDYALSIDYHVPIGNLPAHYRNSPENFPDRPYLKADPKAVQRWREQIGPGVNVGISWQGGLQKTNSYKRSFPLEKLLPLFKKFQKEGVNWVSLQYGRVFDEVIDLENSHGVKIKHYDWALEDYTETANLTAACDIVVSVITAIVHLSGALGVPTLVMVPVAPPWKFVEGEKMPWHPSIKQIHQEKMFAWEEVLGKIETELDSFLKGASCKKQP